MTTTNQLHWDQVAAFDIDSTPVSAYNFSTRLACENAWTTSFAEGAILEYKAFMYLAATSGSMVSPSPIVDKVWHLHLIFTQSYQEFCQLLGKRIEHIPSTHHRMEAEKFKHAKEHTKSQYEAVFGKQPAAYWDKTTMLDGLPLEKSDIKFESYTPIFSILFVLAVIAFYFILYPVYSGIDNPWFLLAYIGAWAGGFIFLENYNTGKLSDLVRSWDKDAFVFHLNQHELTYLKKGKLHHVMHGFVNQLVVTKKINVQPDYRLVTAKQYECSNAFEYTVLDTLANLKSVFYPVLLRDCIKKPVFNNIANSMNALKRHISHSKANWQVFQTNLIVLGALFMLGTVRLLTGIYREKPVEYLVAVLVVFLILSFFWLVRADGFLAKTILPEHCQRALAKSVPAIASSPEWAYFFSGNAVLATAFVPLVNYTERNNTGSSGDSGTSCGSSCGSSCGGGCGGCGGD